MKRLSVILLSFLLYLPLCAQFKGTVYVDTNQSGTFDKGDKPLAGVMVTDGMNVVKQIKKAGSHYRDSRKPDLSALLHLPDSRHNNSTSLSRRTEKAMIL